MLQNGITRKIGGVLFAGTSDLTATAHSENDSQSENPVKVKVIGKDIVMQNLAGLFRLTAKISNEDVFYRNSLEKLSEHYESRDNPNDGVYRMPEGWFL